jgi:hypothetical protein
MEFRFKCRFVFFIFDFRTIKAFFWKSTSAQQSLRISLRRSIECVLAPDAVGSIVPGMHDGS